MKININELESVMIMSTNYILGGLSVFKMSAQIGLNTDIIKMMIRELGHFEKAVKFTRSHLDEISAETRSQLEECLANIDIYIIESIKLINEYNQSGQNLK